MQESDCLVNAYDNAVTCVRSPCFLEKPFFSLHAEDRVMGKGPEGFGFPTYGQGKLLLC